MTEVERLKDELALALALEPLEAAREAMHAKRTDATIAAYKAASDDVAKARQTFREKHPPAAQSGGDAVATPATVNAKAGVDRP